MKYYIYGHIDKNISRHEFTILRFNILYTFLSVHTFGKCMKGNCFLAEAVTGCALVSVKIGPSKFHHFSF